MPTVKILFENQPSKNSRLMRVRWKGLIRLIGYIGLTLAMACFIEAAVEFVLVQLFPRVGLHHIARWFFLHTICGAVAAYVVHEIGHAIPLVLARGVSSLRIEFNWLRVSLIPAGSISRVNALVIAVSGPLSAALVGFILLMYQRPLSLVIWYFFQLLFLLPIFGDGRAIIRAMTVKG